MTDMRLLTAGIACTMLFANAAIAQTQARQAGSQTGRTVIPTLPSCQGRKSPVTLQILTNASSGWTMNGSPAAAMSVAGWANASPAQWIGASDVGATSVTYVVHFNTPFPHGAMTVSAQWAADNCGTGLQGGTGTIQLIGPCYAGNKDFMYFNHYAASSFAPADIGNPQPAITFSTSNESSSAAGLAGIFTVTAQCRR